MAAPVGVADTQRLLFADIDEPGLRTLPVYERRGGYESLRKALSMSPNEVLQQITDSSICHCAIFARHARRLLENRCCSRRARLIAEHELLDLAGGRLG